MRLTILLGAALFWTASAQAQDLPPPDLLKAILSKLEGGKVLPAKIAFAPTGAAVDQACGMQSYDMLLSKGPTTRKYSVLIDPQTSEPAAPRHVFAQISRLMVDADGSGRAYHPLDPDGEGVCRRAGGGKLEGACALDRFRSGQVHVFRGADKLKKPDLAPAWAEFWPLIRDRKLKSVAIRDIPDANVPKSYHLFYSREKNMTAFFKDTIIPLTNDGYPCMHGSESRHAGYFVAATTLTQKGVTRADGCTPSRFIDAEQIPFFVLPGGSFGQVQIGDIVIARLRNGGADRLVYGIAADAGPITNFGEGSIALNQALLGKSGETVMNVRDVEALDIDSNTVSILILGGTKHLLNSDYSRANIEAVGRRELARWNSGSNPLRRLDACAAQAKVNAAK